MDEQNYLTLNLNEDNLNKIIKKIQNIDLNKTQNKAIKYNFKLFETNVTIYNSNKMLIQGKNIDNVLNYFDLSKEEITDNFNFDDTFIYELGSDETGTGDFFGGVVVCATKIKGEDIEILKKFKINDSKKLNDKYILEIGPKLIKIIKHKIVSISALKYNTLIDKYKNSNIIKTILHNKALWDLYDKDCLVCIDQFVNEDKYYLYLKEIGEKNICKINKFEVKGDSKFYSVACASVISRFWLLTQIKTIEDKLKIKVPLGAWNSNIESVATKILNEFGIETLKKVCKTHFQSFSTLLKKHQ